MPELRAAAATADMTPPVGIPLAGFWAPRPAEGIDTPLAAHALVLDDGSTKLAFVALDLIALLAGDADAAKERIRRAAGIPPEHVLVACSHTHEAPYPCPLLSGDSVVEPDYLARVRDAILEAVAAANDALAPAEAAWAAAPAEGVCRNRRRLVGDRDGFNTWQLPPEECDAHPPAGPVDEELAALLVRRASGEPVAALWNCALHAHAFACPRVHADYPYYVRQKLAEQLGGGFVGAFTAGACGDIGRRSNVDGPAVVDRLAGTLLRLWEGAQFSAAAPLAAAVETFEAPLRDFSTFQEEEIRRKQPAALEVCREEWEILRAGGQRRVRTVLQVAAVGDFALAAVPGELFCALGLEVKRRSPFAVTAVAELANDYVGYIPTDAAYDQGGYELFNVRSSKVARGTGERIRDRLAAMLAALKPRRGP